MTKNVSNNEDLFARKLAKEKRPFHKEVRTMWNIVRYYERYNLQEHTIHSMTYDFPNDLSVQSTKLQEECAGRNVTA